MAMMMVVEMLTLSQVVII